MFGTKYLVVEISRGLEGEEADSGFEEVAGCESAAAGVETAEADGGVGAADYGKG